MKSMLSFFSGQVCRRSSLQARPVGWCPVRRAAGQERRQRRRQKVLRVSQQVRRLRSGGHRQSWRLPGRGNRLFRRRNVNGDNNGIF